MTLAPTRFAGIGRAGALALLLLLIVACGSAFVPRGETPSTPPAKASPPGTDNADILLYERIVERVKKGEPYHAAALSEQRSSQYPSAPFVTVRLPTLALVAATVGTGPLRAILILFCLLTLIVWWRRFAGSMPGATHIIATFLVGIGLLLPLRPELVLLHEAWAGVLIALAIGLHRDEHWWPSVLIAALSLAIRELALPIVLLMGAWAATRKDWKQAGAWVAVALLFGIALYGHAQAVWALASPLDRASPGWSSFGGWHAFAANMQLTTALRFLPASFAISLLPLCLIGWAGWREKLGLLIAALLTGYACMFMVFGRPDNFYWGLMIAPLFLGGLVLVPAIIRDLWKAARA